MSKIISFCLLILLGTPLSAHKFYTSITDISFNDDTKSFEIIVKLFVDDFDKAIEDNYRKKLYLGTENEIEDDQHLIEKYLNKHFSIFDSKKQYDFIYLGNETDRDYIWLYIEVPKVKQVKDITIKNSLLTDVFLDQTNLINLEIKTGILSTTLHKDLKEYTFTFNK